MSYPSYPVDPGAGHVARPGVIPLRPLGVGDILKGAFAIVGTRPGLTLGVTAVVMAVSYVIGLVATVSLYDEFVTMVVDGTLPSGQLWGTLAIGVLVSAASFVLWVLLGGFLTIVAGAAVAGRRQTVDEVLTAIRPRLLSLLGFTLLAFLAAAATFLVIFVVAMIAGPLAYVVIIAAVLVGTWLVVQFSLASTAIVLEHAGIRRAFGRSWELVSGSWWRVFGISLLASIIGAVVVGVIDLLLTLTESGFLLMAIGSVVASALTEPFIAAVTVLIYTDQRIRREGLAAELARPAAS